MTDRECLIALSAFPAFGPARLKVLLDYFGKASEIWKAKESVLLEIGINSKLVKKFVAHKKTFDPIEYFRSLEKLKINTFTIFEKNYPENLREIPDAPFTIYVRGTLTRADERAVSIVGTRMMTSYGKEIAARFGRELSDYGITVVSGLALGIDSEAQKSATKAGGRTISVLASGLDIISPLANKNLALEFIKSQGALVSEYPLGHTPMPYEFPVRDRLISGMSKAVIVVEGRMKSGTFHTVRAALDQGRPVFAVPGQITSPASEGTNYLIQNGAKLIASIKDVLEELNLEVMVDRDKMEKIVPTDRNEEKLLKSLEKESLHLDEIVRISGLTTSEVSARLTIMEMKGIVRNVGGGVYKKS